MNAEQLAWAMEHPWYRESRNVRAYRGGVWWEVTAFDSERGCDVLFDSFNALKDWATKQLARSA